MVSYQVKDLFGAEGCSDQYIRIAPERYDVSHQMDDASPQNIDKIKEAGNRYITIHSKQLDEIICCLVNNH